MADETERMIQERVQIMEVIEQQEAAIIGQITSLEKQITEDCKKPWYNQLPTMTRVLNLMEQYKRLITVKQNKHDKETQYFDTICQNAGYDPDKYVKKEDKPKQTKEIKEVKTEKPTSRTMSDKEKADFISAINPKIDEWLILSSNFPEKGNLKKANIIRLMCVEPFKDEKREILEQLMKEAQDGE